MNFYVEYDITGCLVSIVFKINGSYLPLKQSRTNKLVSGGIRGMQMYAVPKAPEAITNHQIRINSRV